MSNEKQTGAAPRATGAREAAERIQPLERIIAACQSAAPRCPVCHVDDLSFSVRDNRAWVTCCHPPCDGTTFEIKDASDMVKFFFPAPAGGERPTQETVCPYRLGQTVYWQGQDGQKSGDIHNITEPEPGNYVLWFADDSLINAAQVTAAPEPPQGVGDVQGYCVVCKSCGKGEYQPGLYFHALDDCDGGFMAVAIRKFPELARAEKALGKGE